MSRKTLPDSYTGLMLEQYRLASVLVLSTLYENLCELRPTVIKQPEHWKFDLTVGDNGELTVKMNLVSDGQSCTFIRGQAGHQFFTECPEGVHPKDIRHAGYWFGNLVWLAARVQRMVDLKEMERESA